MVACLVPLMPLYRCFLPFSLLGLLRFTASPFYATEDNPKTFHCPFRLSPPVGNLHIARVPGCAGARFRASQRGSAGAPEAVLRSGRARMSRALCPLPHGRADI